jgi:hypothetical protein
MKKGYRIYLIQQDKTPKEIIQQHDNCNNIFNELKNFDFENNTYAIRIGKNGLE